MVRKFMPLMAILALGFIASSASAKVFTQTAPGDAVKMTVDKVKIPGAADVNFQPSSKVQMAGASQVTSFALISGHEAVRGKEAGQNYGMASDSSNVFWEQAPATFPTFTDSNSGPFQNSPWNRN